jgi:hypothetical protein
MYLFFTSDNGRMWREQTTVENFPFGWSDPVLAYQGDIFEGSHIYRLDEQDLYLNLIEENTSGDRRFFKSFTADSLDGEWSPLAATLENPYAAAWGGGENVFQTAARWTDYISHGEMLRSGVNEYMKAELDAPFFFQGVDHADRQTAPSYGEIPWKLGLLYPVKEAEDGELSNGSIQSDDDASGEAFVNGGSGFVVKWTVRAIENNYDLRFRLKAPTHGRSMGVWVNDVKAGVLTSSNSSWHNHTLASVQLNSGLNTIELRDSEDTLSLDIDKLELEFDGISTVTNCPATVSFETPADGDSLYAPADLYVKVQAFAKNGIDFVRLRVNGMFLHQENHAPYEWSDDTDSELNNMPAGTYELTAEATDHTGTATQSGITIYVTEDPSVGVQGKVLDDPAFGVYPNPSQEMLYINTRVRNFRVDIYNLLGNLVCCAPENAGQSEIDISSLQSGVYIARIASDKYSRVVKLIKR